MTLSTIARLPAAGSTRRRSVLRLARKELSLGLLRLGMDFARRSNADGADALHRIALAAVRACVPLRLRLARNMKAVGLYRRGLADQHFERAAEQFAMLMHIFRAGFPASGVSERFAFDDSWAHLEQAYKAGRGVLVVAPHLCAYPIVPRVLSERVPCAIYLRRSRDPRKHAINEAIGRAGGGELIHPPTDGSRLERLMVAMKVLREGRALYVTPDLPRPPDDGVPVTILGRTVHFPTGVMVMAMRTGAAVVMCRWRYEGGRYRLYFAEPIDLAGRGDRARRIAGGMAQFAAMMDASIRAQPELWWNWLDKRWTRILRGWE
jgi:lauroyl/myristoyl acyltransferase